MGKHNAAFINVIAEEGSKAEAVEFLQQTWDELMNLRLALLKLGYKGPEIAHMMRTGEFHGQKPASYH